MNKRTLFIAGILILLLAAAALLPPLRTRISGKLEEAQILLRSWLAPPERQAFVPQQAGTALPSAAAALPSLTATHTSVPTATPPASTPLASAVLAQPSPTPTVTPTALPASVMLQGVKYQDQHGLWNYCAPSNLAMALSFWGIDVDRTVVGKAVKPNQYDKNVMPYEMADYVAAHTDLQAVVRAGGDLDLLRRFSAAGLPVLVEKGAWIKDFSGVVSWMGHYQVVTGYDDARQVIIAQDSYFTPDYEVSYADYQRGWRSFNYTFLVIYPAEKEAQVMGLLGPLAGESASYQHAAEVASNEIYALSGADQVFAWYNRGTSLKELEDYSGAAAAYDEAFAIYNTLPEDKSVRPYRLLWYETGPYFAYYYTGRYYDVISLATAAIESVVDARPALEESFYWRAMANYALGDQVQAARDFKESLVWHPNFEPTIYQMEQLGLQP